jgi:hypothetical protein
MVIRIRQFFNHALQRAWNRFPKEQGRGFRDDKTDTNADKPAMQRRLASPYLAPGFYEEALAKGRHRDIVGGRWEETGRIQMQILQAAGLEPHHHLLDIGAGSLRLGCKAVPYLQAGHYWATDASRALMLRGHETELADPARLDPSHLIEDATFAFPGLPDCMDFAIAFGVFTHLPAQDLTGALASLRQRLPRLKTLLVTVFVAPDDQAATAWRQDDGVVTHPDRPPYHRRKADILGAAQTCGWQGEEQTTRLPRGQRLFVLQPMTA